MEIFDREICLKMAFIALASVTNESSSLAFFFVRFFIFDSVWPKFNYFSLTDGLSCYDIYGITAVKEVVCQLVFKAKIFFTSYY
jgi:hypothetical protein